ncbi:hypothetical protein C9374_004084 [Naegleria lovaniensis]|uniref:Uncharacterized protein n=1 Tax=Naegleria lovaniensis TaxID=51637 RepID=A0AA88GSM0_NAELO|nr:uncharacterized protein C9374_004084 [Naegleria lovaniensis]KAG2383413.1 hypothetical protein C9374_004084 [Naegleria lovaniensis]
MELEDQYYESFQKTNNHLPRHFIMFPFQSHVHYSEMIPPKLHNDYQERFIINVVQLMDDYYLFLFDLWQERWIEQSKCSFISDEGDESTFGIFFFENHSPYFLLLQYDANTSISGTIFKIDFSLKTISLYKTVEVFIHHNNFANSDFMRVHSTIFNLGRATKNSVQAIEQVSLTDLSIDYEKVYGKSRPSRNGSLLWKYNEQDNCGCIISYGGLQNHCYPSDFITRVDFWKGTDDIISYQVNCLPFDNWRDLLSFFPNPVSYNAVGLIGGRYLVSIGGTDMGRKVETHNLCLFDCYLQAWVGVLEPEQDPLNGIEDEEELTRLLRLNGRLLYLRNENKFIYFGGSRKSYLRSFDANFHTIKKLGYYEIKLPSSVITPSLVFTFPWRNFHDLMIVFK